MLLPLHHAPANPHPAHANLHPATATVAAHRKFPSLSTMAPPVHLPTDLFYGGVILDDNLETQIRDTRGDSKSGLQLLRGE